MKSFIQKSTIILAVAIAGLAAGASAATIGLGTTMDTLSDTSKWYGTTAGTTWWVNPGASGYYSDPLDPAKGFYAADTLATVTGFPAEGPAWWTYKANSGLRISKVLLSIAVDTGSPSLYQGIGIADSTGQRIASVAYANPPMIHGGPTAASYSGITETYTDIGADTHNGSEWYTLELNLPASAVSLIDGHTETFNQVSVGFWYGPWSAFVGTVDLTVVPVPEPAALALLGLGALALLRRRRA